VIHRWLDVFFEWAVWLIVILVGVPSLIGAVAFVSDRSQLVTARVWADRPSLLQAAGLANQWSNGTPSSDASALLTELVGSDWFADKVLTDTDSGFGLLTLEQKTQQRQLMRQSLKQDVLGDHVLVLSYLTDQPERGRALLSSLILRLGDSVESLDAIQTSAAIGLLDSEVAKARAVMQSALDAADKYAAGKTPAALAQDAHYQTLAADAAAATNYYVSLNYQAQQAHLAQSALPSIRNSTFRVLDPPAVTPKELSLRTPAIRYALEALGATAAIEFLIVYLIGLRDPRVRSPEEVRKRLGIPSLGSTPNVRRAA
jgi:hypothetical protein